MRQPQPLILTIAGILLTLVGLGLCVYNGWMCYSGSLDIGLITTDSPTQSVEAITCPPQWASGQADSVAIMLYNPLKRTANYRIDFKYYTDTHTLDYNGSDTLSFDIPAQQRQTIALPEFKPSGSALYQYVQVYAYSDDDLANLATFHDWPSSYQGHCGVRLQASSGSRQLKLSSLLGLLMVVAGIGGCFLVNRKARRVYLVVCGILALISIAVALDAAGYVLKG